MQKRQQFKDEFKRQAAQLLEAHDRSVAAVAREPGIPKKSGVLQENQPAPFTHAGRRLSGFFTRHGGFFAPQARMTAKGCDSIIAAGLASGSAR